MQNAKDSFYIALRTRLAALDPGRTILLRGSDRPGILVEEAEAPYSQLPSDVFVLRWSAMGTDTHLRLTMVAAECEIFYQTSGSQAYGGLDRGRALSTMDTELMSILSPYSTQKMNYLTATPVAMQTQVFWDEPVFTSIVANDDLLSRSAKVMVYSYQEQEE